MNLRVAEPLREYFDYRVCGGGGTEREREREREGERERERMNKLYFTKVVEKTRGRLHLALARDGNFC